jgi:predicted metal-dependent hydrolase
MEKICLAGRSFQVEVKRKAIGSWRLHLKSKNTLAVSCPLFSTETALANFIRQHHAWIIKNANKITDRRTWVNPKTIKILGKSLSRARIEKLNGATLEQKLKLLAGRLIDQELKIIRQDYPISFGRVSIRNQRTRFGSCSVKGNLNFNWQIIFFPREKFRHILIHELAHLKIKNHSPDFWNLLAQYDPKWRQNARWLRKEGSKRFLV